MTDEQRLAMMNEVRDVFNKYLPPEAKLHSVLSGAQEIVVKNPGLNEFQFVHMVVMEALKVYGIDLDKLPKVGRR